jgi:glycosyltransferase involved in cell wall biosynthesis
VGRRRILHITTFLQGGAGRIVADLACAQQRAGDDVAVVCAADGIPGYGHYPAWLAQLAEHAIPVLPVTCTFRRSLHHLMHAVDAIERAPWTSAGIDLVHAHAAVPALVAHTFVRRVPVLATMHGWNGQKAAEHAATDVAVFNRLPIVAVPSAAAAAHLETAGVEAARLSVVPYGVAPQDALGLTGDDEALVAQWRHENRLIAVCVGSVGARKRQAMLLDALASPALRARMACAFIGEGPDLAAFTARAAALGVAPATAWLGYRPNVTDWLRTADLAVFPSQREGLPLALLESAALGVCAVASDIDEHRAVLTHDESGLLFERDDPDGLVTALTRAADLGPTGRRALAAEAHARWSAWHRPEHMHTRYDELYAAVSDQTLVSASGARP